MKKKEIEVGGMIMKAMYFPMDDLVFLENLKNEGIVDDRSKFIRACMKFVRANKENLKMVLSYVEA